MKNARILLAAVLAVTAIGFTACGSSDSVPTTSDVPASSAASDVEVMPAQVAVAYAEEGAESELTFVEPQFADSEYLVRLSLTTDAPISAVQLLDISLGDVAEDGTASFVVNSAIGTEAFDLEPEQTLILGTAFEGDTATRGISYVDADGEMVYLALSQSGEDGSLIVEPFLPAAPAVEDETESEAVSDAASEGSSEAVSSEAVSEDASSASAESTAE